MKKVLFLATALLLLMAPQGAKAQMGVESYVSASGYVIYHASGKYSPNGGYFCDFEKDFEEGRIIDWTLIDADGDSHNWQLPPTGGMGYGGTDGMLVSYSYDNGSASPLTPDNFLVSPRVTIPEFGGRMEFYACPMDGAYPAENFAVAISTTVNDDPSAFTTLQEWTMVYSGWGKFMVNLSAYAGQEVYIAIRHYNCTDQFALCIDDFFVGGNELFVLDGCDIVLDGQTVATNQHGSRYLLDTDGFADGSIHITTIRAHYEDGATLENVYTWTYRTPDHFQGSPTGLQAESDGDRVQLSWTLPTMSAPFPVDELYYDFSDSTLMDLTLIDANNDGQNFRVYPYGGYGGGIGLRSWSWMSGANNLNPDNYLVTPRLTATADASISFMACDADMPGIAPDPEHFGVAVSTSGNTNPNDFVMVAEWNSTGTYTEYTADLSAYAGQQIYVAIRHFNTTGECYFLCVDDIRTRGVEAEVTRDAIGALVYADGEMIALLNHGETSFTHEVNRYTSEYCIRIIQDGSRETGDYYALAALQCANAEVNCVAPKNLAAEYDGNKVTVSWEREIFIDFENDPEGWSFLDADGDGAVFGIYAAGGMNPDGSVNTEGTNASLASFSYMNGYGALQPDNYAFMPKVKVLENAKMAFYAAGFDPSYQTEHFGVAVASADGTQVSTIGEFDSRNPYQRYEVDLSAYAGQEIFLGFRHFTNIANYALVIDNITVTNAVWAGTASETIHYHVYRSFDGSNYNLIGYADGDAVSYDDNDIQSVTCYYKVTAVNTMPGNTTCESAPAMAVDGIHDYVTVQTDGVNELNDDTKVYPNPTNGQITIEAEGMSHVTIMNALGQTVYDASTDADQTVLDLSRYGTGMYLIRISSEKSVCVKRVPVVK